MSPPDSAPVDLSPDGTHFRLSLTKAVMIIAALIGGAYAAGTTTSDLKHRLTKHEDNELIHLDPKFVFQHGVPVGAWDMDASVKALSGSIAAVQAQTKELEAWKSKQETAADARKPRWHGGNP